jgi:hypothetical protein
VLVSISLQFVLQHLTHQTHSQVHSRTLHQRLRNRISHGIRTADQLSHGKPALQDRQRLAESVQRVIHAQRQSTLKLFCSLTHWQTPRAAETR